jgi:ABC-2 type transport system ATP-binding protein
MSLGQRMKMELIASMLHNPKVVFLDEPTIGLDVMSQNNLRKFIKEYNKQTGATVILTSHNLLDVEALCRKVILINDGKVTHNKTLKDLTNIHDYKVITLNGIIESLNESTLPDGMTIASEKDKTVIIKVKKDICQDAVKFIWANFTFEDVRVEDVGIQEIIEKAFADKGEVEAV